MQGSCRRRTRRRPARRSAPDRTRGLLRRVAPRPRRTDADQGRPSCEVVALPTALSGRGYVAYCPFNLVDAAERPLRRRPDVLGRAAAVIALLVAGWFLVAAALLDALGVHDPVPAPWALLLLAPAALLAVRAVQASRAKLATATSLALGAAATTAGALALADLLPADAVFAAAVLAGPLVAAARAVARRRSTGSEASPP